MMAEIESSEKLSREEVVKRVRRMREGLEMSRTAFGELRAVTWKGQTVSVHTDRHTMVITKECWKALGESEDDFLKQLKAEGVGH